MSRQTWYKRHADYLSLMLQVKPYASRTAMTCTPESGITVSLAAVPEDGKANRLLVKYLSRTLRVPAGTIELAQGATARTKRLHIRATPTEQQRILSCLGVAAGES